MRFEESMSLGSSFEETKLQQIPKQSVTKRPAQQPRKLSTSQSNCTNNRIGDPQNREEDTFV